MKKQRLGRSGLMVSPVGMGGIPIMRLAVDEAVEVVRHAQQQGITFFDTANKYNDSEVKMGIALEGVRDQVVIASKSLARDARTMAEHVDMSLQRLRTGYIDIYQHHQVAGMDVLEAILAPDGAQEALTEAKAQGKIGHMGICCHNLYTAVAAMETGQFDTLQIAFNFIENEPLEQIFPLARKLDIGLIGMKPLGGGLLRPARLCFSFLTAYDQIIPVPGMETIAQVDEILEFYQGEHLSLTHDDQEQMRRLQDELGNRFCHRCEYCMPCPQGINIPRTLHFRSIKAKYSAVDALAWVPKNTDFSLVQECLECGECVQRCPYELYIPDLLKECLQLFEQVKAEAAPDAD